MYKIPDSQRRFLQMNNSDLFGNVHYTKNIDFDEEGYLKLAPRAVSIRNSETDTAFNLPLAFGRKSTGDFFVVTAEDPFTASINETNLSAGADTDSDDEFPPDFSFDSHGKWWQGLWHVSLADAVWFKTPSDNDWTDTGITLTTGKTHMLEVFLNRNTLVVGNGNVLKQYSTVYGASTDLTIPSDFEILGVAYSNNRVGIATMLANTTTSQAGEAYFFVWDGSGSDANQGYGVGSDMILAVKAYKSSWVILTREGNLLYFNGGGFQFLASLPVFYTDRSWGDSVNREALGDIMQVKGDVIYINVNNSMEPFGDRGEEYIPNSPGGVLCYDPKVGIYHRYSPSISSANLLTVASGDINTTTNRLTKSTGTLYTTKMPIKYVYDGTTPIGGLKVGTIYYAIVHSATVFQLATTPENAEAGIAIDLTSTGAASNYFLSMNLLDYGASRMARTGAVGLSERQNQVMGELIFGGEYYDSNSTSSYEHFNVLVNGLPNRGYVVTSKMTAEEITDVIQKVYLKYRPLNSISSIIIKEKTEEILGIPVTTPQFSVHCTWTGTDRFTTTADLSDVLTYLNTNNESGWKECEVEIISGAGGGSTAQIESISYLTGTYTVILAEDIDGATNGFICDVLIENWKKIGEITQDPDTFKEFASGKKSKQAKYKVELRGSDVIIEEIQAVNQTYKPST